ncbi:MAG: hypothetical protein E6H91_03645 [Chloroflexi bacterium]|nr:MAG: hypothetical protein E6H91_03645 [Chloroflexota bacterium]
MNERRVVHLKGSSSLGPKCGATDASIVTNWVLGATYHEVYVPADVLQRADLVCERCQDAALADDSGSDDEVVPDTEEEDSRPAQDEGDPAFAEVSDQRLLRELARRLGDEAALAEEQSEKTEDRRN